MFEACLRDHGRSGRSGSSGPIPRGRAHRRDFEASRRTNPFRRERASARADIGRFSRARSSGSARCACTFGRSSECFSFPRCAARDGFDPRRRRAANDGRGDAGGEAADGRANAARHRCRDPARRGSTFGRRRRGIGRRARQRLPRADPGVGRGTGTSLRDFRAPRHRRWRGLGSTRGRHCFGRLRLARRPRCTRAQARGGLRAEARAARSRWSRVLGRRRSLAGQ